MGTTQQQTESRPEGAVVTDTYTNIPVSVDELTGRELARALIHKQRIELAGTFERLAYGGKIIHQTKVYQHLQLTKWGTLAAKRNGKVVEVQISRWTLLSSGNSSLNFKFKE